MSRSPADPRPSLVRALVKPLHLGVLGVGGLVGGAALFAAASIGSVGPALGVVALTGLSYVGLIGADLLLRSPPPPPPPPERPTDDLEARLRAIEAAAERLNPLFEHGGAVLLEAQLRVATLVGEAAATVARTRRLRALLAEHSAAAAQEQVRALEAQVAAARDPEARELLQMALSARKAQRSGRKQLVALEERGHAALTVAESVLAEMWTRLSRLAHEGEQLEEAGLVAEVDGLRAELATLQKATENTLAEMGQLD